MLTTPRPLSLTSKRTLAGAYLVVLVVCAGTYYLGWALFAPYDRAALAVVTLVGAVIAARYGNHLVEELRRDRAAKDSASDSRGGDA